MKSTFSTLRATLAGAALALCVAAPALAAGEDVVMYKDPNCGCCGAWAEHMREHGFSVKEIATREMAEVKQKAGVPRTLGSCHTAKVGGYIVEGHVPAADVRRLLAEKPAGMVGISAPGMPLGSPGMEGPYPAENYEVVSFDRAGKSTVFARH
ncbi:DUF411 domain-containing protein [Pseudothauera nasutitermitis]|uniref:DUF411 domain-containing protein n=1 Tax=Pseudothauera nasutitermitis TaxID=2565930 RepID=A0A4S4AND9_9RHOO|nr:DUF411 domain-containing protein [Pseudothauera nasutitermitis]THF61143.1 DUF411 domain-containing protein [Pseudothauera nasutitermitis]